MSIHLSFSSCFCLLFLLFFIPFVKNTCVFNEVSFLVCRFGWLFDSLFLQLCGSLLHSISCADTNSPTHTLSQFSYPQQEIQHIDRHSHTHMHLARRDQSNCMCLSCHYVNLKNIQTIIPAQRYFSLLFVPLKFYTGMVYQVATHTYSHMCMRVCASL